MYFKIRLDIRLRISVRGVTHTFMVIGDTSGRVTKGQGDVTTGTIYVRLTELNERDFSQFAVMNDARERLFADYPDLKCAVQDVAKPFPAAVSAR